MDSLADPIEAIEKWGNNKIKFKIDTEVDTKFEPDN